MHFLEGTLLDAARLVDGMEHRDNFTRVRRNNAATFTCEMRTNAGARPSHKAHIKRSLRRNHRALALHNTRGSLPTSIRFKSAPTEPMYIPHRPPPFPTPPSLNLPKSSLITQ